MEHRDKENEKLSVERLVFFSDAVIAIAITLLVLDIKVPKADSADELWRALSSQWTNYLSFFISFSIIAVVWTNHHRMFTFIDKVDHNLMSLNTLLLMCIVLIPFSTALLSEYLNKPGSYIGALIYGCTLTIGGIFYNWFWRYAVNKRRLVKQGADQKEINVLSRHYIQGPILYFIATLTSFFNSYVSLAIYIFLIIYFYIPKGLRKNQSS